MEALELCPENPELLTTVGLLYLKLGNNTKAFEYLGNSLTYDPRSAKTILAAGSIIQASRGVPLVAVAMRLHIVLRRDSAFRPRGGECVRCTSDFHGDCDGAVLRPTSCPFLSLCRSSV
jgi:hypothetical protein